MCYPLYWCINSKVLFLISPKPHRNIQQKTIGNVTKGGFCLFCLCSLTFKLYSSTNNMLYFLSKCEWSLYQILSLVAVNDERQSSGFLGIAAYFRVLRMLRPRSALSRLLDISLLPQLNAPCSLLPDYARMIHSPAPVVSQSLGQPHSAGTERADTLCVFPTSDTWVHKSGFKILP